MQYHAEIEKLDAEANRLYAAGLRREAMLLIMEAGALQQRLIKPIGKRYLTAQWVWAYGHMGMLHQLIRWFRHSEPSTTLVLETRRMVRNVHFLKALQPWLTIVDDLPEELANESMENAVYFNCPDGLRSIHNFYKMVERECKERLLTCSPEVGPLLQELGVRRPYIALHARNTKYDPSRNVTLDMITETLRRELEAIAPGGEEPHVVSIGLDQHPINGYVPNILSLRDPPLASFQLSAACDRFIGSDSGAWTIANAYGKPVTVMNDFQHKGWIYPEEFEE